MFFKNNTKGIFIILLVFGIIFCSISLVNHFLFRTHAWDLGISNNAIYDYAHFRWNDCTLMQPQFANVLSDHFSLIPVLVSPLYWVLGSYTMLVVQIWGILFGGLGVYVYFSARTKNRWIPNLAAIHFFSIWGIYSALSFDYHDNVMGAMFVPWFLHYFNWGNRKKTILFFLLILISKENMALWMLFICLGLFLSHLKNKKLALQSGIFLLASLIYFTLIVKIVIPSMANEGREYLHFHYSALGDNFLDASKTLITQPGKIIKLLFYNHSNNPLADGIKAELHYTVLLSGGIALFLRPQYLLMLIPIYAQKLFNDDFGKWGLIGQYSVEFVPVLTVALFSLLNDIKKEKLQKNTALVAVLITMITTGHKIDSRGKISDSAEQYRFYQARHYTQGFDVQELYRALELIPENARVSAQAFIVPHVAFRDYIYQFPVVKEAEYIIVMTGETPYPLNEEKFDAAVKIYRESAEWEIIYDQNRTLIFRKKIFPVSNLRQVFYKKFSYNKNEYRKFKSKF